MPLTQAVERQIADQAITDAKVKAGAAIQTSKLAEGIEFVKRNGTVPFTGAVDLGNNTISNLAPAVTNLQAPNFGQVKTLIDNLSSVYKYKSVRVATTSNVVLATPLAVYDGVTLVLLDRLLLPAQTAQAENGIWIFNGVGVPLTRAVDADAWNEFTGCTVSVNEGTINGDTRWFCPANDGGTVGVTTLTFNRDVVGALNASNFVDKETPIGLVNGTNTVYTVLTAPALGSEHLYLNGYLQESGVGNDYTILSNSITMAVAPLTGEKIRISYRK